METEGAFFRKWRQMTKELSHDSTLAQVLTVDELAALFRLNRKTVYQAIAKNQIPGIQRIGRQFRASRDVVLAWLAQGGAPAVAADETSAE
jgi:excisionase family DNA binding protein